MASLLSTAAVATSSERRTCRASTCSQESTKTGVAISTPPGTSRMRSPTNELRGSPGW